MLISVVVILGAALAQAEPQTMPQAPNAAVAATTARDYGLNAELAQKLLSAKRIYVESFGADSVSRTLQAMIVDAIGTSKRFIVTESKEKADLVLKGAALEKTTEEAHSLDSSTKVAGASGGGSSHIYGSANSAGANVTGSSHGGFVAHSLGVADSQASVETVNDARVSVRLVAKDGDVVWSTTQESKGAKYKGATADVADKVIKQLLRDLARLEQKPPSQL